MTEFLHGGNVWNDGEPDSWVDFSANLNPKGPPKEMIRELKNSIDRICYYPEINMKSPTKNIADYLNVPPENILPTGGGIGALNLIVESLRPSKIIILQPAFVEYLHLAQNISADVENISLINDNDDIYYDKEKILKSMVKGSMIFICNPSNPIGCTAPGNIIKSISNKAKEVEATVVVDEAFIEFAQDESIKDKALADKHIIVAGSLTKIFAIPGIRIGYICAHKDHISNFKARQTPWSLSSFAYDVTNALSYLGEYVKESVAENEIERNIMSENIKALGIKVYDSKANYLFLNFKDMGIQVSSLQEWLRPHRVLLRNCSNYIFLNDYFTRVAVKKREENLVLVDLLKKYIAQEKK